MKQFSTHNLDKLLVPDTTILNKTVDRWRTFHPTITCAIKDCRIQMTTMAPSQVAWLQGKDCVPWCSVPRIIGKLFPLHTTHTWRQLLQFRLQTSSSEADSSHPITHPRHIEMAPSWTWETGLRAPKDHKPRTSNRVKMSCEKQLTTQIDKKKKREMQRN